MGDGRATLRRAVGPIARLPLHPLLLAAYAVLFVYAANIGEVLPEDIVAPLSLALAAAAIVLAICAALFRDLRRGAILTSALLGTFAFFGHIASLLDAEVITEPVQLALWAAFVVLAGTYAALARSSLSTVTATLNAFGLVLVAITLFTILPFESGRAARASEGTPMVVGSALATATRVPERDIYFLVFDRYGSDWAIKQRFGIDNDLYPDLEEAGFQVIPGARANYRATDFSLASMLSMELLDDLTASVGPGSSDRTPARARIPRHEVGKFLRANGYRYYHLGAWYGPTRSNEIADEVRRWDNTTELEAVLREATILPTLERLAGLAPQDDAFRDRHRNEALFEFRQIRRLADTPGRKFVFAHILLPHPPYGFDADGGIVLKETELSAIAEGREGDLFAEQLAFTNDKIRETISVLLDRPADEQPIIVITGDEGPFICGNVDCIDGSPEAYGTRFGTLRAYHLPDLDYAVPSDDTGVNIFRMLFREYFGADLPDLPNRSYDWPDNENLYDFRDVTDELPLPGGEGSG
ncbi:MAG: hypothetical protein ACC726_14885 [Chloroflexota bacterium]